MRLRITMFDSLGPLAVEHFKVLFHYTNLLLLYMFIIIIITIDDEHESPNATNLMITIHWNSSGCKKDYDESLMARPDGPG